MPKAPGKSHRNGLSLVEIMDMFPDDATAEAWFVQNRWPDGVVHCPECGSLNVQTDAPNKGQPYRCRERECRHRFSVKTGTVMHGSNLSYRKWAIAIYLCLTDLKGVSSMKLHRDLKITQKSAWHMAHRLRKALENGGDGLQFAGPAESDSTFIGGKRRNMSNAKRKELAGTGRGGSGKAIVTGVKDRETNRVAAKVVESEDGPTLKGFVRDHVKPGATLYTDEAGAYKGMPEFDHESVNHSVSEYVRDQAHTNGIESFWAMLKRGYQGTYHKMSHKHLERYVNEFSGRHNFRNADTINQMNELVSGMVGKRLRYTDLTADNGLASGARS